MILFLRLTSNKSTIDDFNELSSQRRKSLMRLDFFWLWENRSLHCDKPRIWNDRDWPLGGTSDFEQNKLNASLSAEGRRSTEKTKAITLSR
jgi:hypothetical protein